MSESKILYLIRNSSAAHDFLDKLRNQLSTVNPNVIDKVLTQLDFYIHSVPALILLSKRVQSKVVVNDSSSMYFNQAHLVLNMLASSINMSGVMSELTSVAKYYVELSYLIRGKNQVSALKTIKKVCDSWNAAETRNRNTIAPLITVLFQTCLELKFPKVALPMLDRDVFEINLLDSIITPEEYLQYFYYGALVYIGLKRYEKALQCLRTCISTPASVLSAIVVAAYKKYVLVSLIVHGNVPQLPRYTSNEVSSNINHITTEYKDISTSFETLESFQLDRTIRRHSKTLLSDENMGLAKQTKKALVCHKIQNLTTAYITISLDDLAKQTGLKDVAESTFYILSMIKQGVIFASIDGVEEVVTFKENPNQHDKQYLMNRLKSDIKKAIDLSKVQKDIDMDIIYSNEFIKKELAQVSSHDLFPGSSDSMDNDSLF